jgi:putative ABC transport system permease protein
VNVRESARFAIRGVLANKLRSLLTMSGIIIGVSAVIILVAAGTGASAAVQKSISSLGSNTITITSVSTGAGGRTAGRGGGGFGGGGGGFGGGGAGGGGARAGGGGAAGGGAAGGGAPGGVPGGAPGAAGAGTVDNGTRIRTPQLTLEDAEALVDPTNAPDVVSVAPVVTAQGVTATDNGASHAVATFTGTSPSYLTNNNDTVATGAAFTDTDYTAHTRVALLGTTVATALVGGDGTAVVGQTVQFNGVAFQVVGLLGAKGSSGPQDQDDRVVAPLTAVQDTLTGYGNVTSISVKASSADTVNAAQAEVTTILDDRHHVTADPDFSIFNPSSILAAVTSTTSIFTLLLGAVAAISLIVGGIGVMNIMLVTVTERTREIGIRKAVGAQRADIVGQFLLEAVLLSMCGGLIGVAIGVAVGQLSVGGFQLVVAPYSVVLAFGVSVAIGLFFGAFPASRAAGLRPIDALRYE